MIEVQAEDGYPHPGYRPTKGKFKYPWGTMEIGQSFLVEGQSHSAVCMQARRMGEKFSRSFTTRNDSKTGKKRVRVWRES